MTGVASGASCLRSQRPVAGSPDTPSAFPDAARHRRRPARDRPGLPRRERRWWRSSRGASHRRASRRWTLISATCAACRDLVAAAAPAVLAPGSRLAEAGATPATVAPVHLARPGAVARRGRGPLRHPRPRRPRRHGRRVRRLRSRAGSEDRAQAAQRRRRGLGSQAQPRPPAEGGQGDRAPQPPQRGRRARRRDDRRSRLHRDGVHRRPDAGGVARAAKPRTLAGDPRRVPGGGPRAGRRARRAHRPPRLQTAERHGRRRRHRPRHGLRPGQRTPATGDADGPVRTRRSGPRRLLAHDGRRADPHRSADWNAGLHGARAVPRASPPTRAPISSASASRCTRRCTASGRSPPIRSPGWSRPSPPGGCARCRSVPASQPGCARSFCAGSLETRGPLRHDGRPARGARPRSGTPAPPRAGRRRSRRACCSRVARSASACCRVPARRCAGTRPAG